MAEKSAYTTEGALYELVCRGKKDNFFFKDSVDDTVTPFDTRYELTPPTVSERRLVVPRNGSDFGQTCEFEFEIAGDVIIDPVLLIQMPSWIPPGLQAAAVAGTDVSGTWQTTIVDASGVAYGWTNGIAYFLFSSIQIYQDNLLLQEFSGEALYASRLSRGSFASRMLDRLQTGFMTTIDPTHISRNAVPGLLRLSLPLIGCQGLQEGGFPSAGLRQQTYKIRAKLRRAEELFLASDGRAHPSPLGRRMFWSAPHPTDLYALKSDADFIQKVLDVSGYAFMVAWPQNYIAENPTVITPEELAQCLAIIQEAVDTGGGSVFQVWYNYDLGDFPSVIASSAVIGGVTLIDDVYYPRSYGAFVVYLYKNGKFVNATYIPSLSEFFLIVPTVQLFVQRAMQNIIVPGLGFTPIFTAAAFLSAPTIQLETRHIYTDAETQRLIINGKQQIPYSRLYENTFTMSPFDYAPLKKGSASIVTRRLDAVHMASRILWFFRKQSDLMANRYDLLTMDASGSEFYNSVSLIIAGRNREDAWSSLVWNKIVSHAKEDCDPGAGLGIINWDLTAGRSCRDRHEPQGSVNFTTADRPTMLIDLSGVTLTNTQLTAVVDTWTTFTVEAGRGSINTYF